MARTTRPSTESVNFSGAANVNHCSIGVNPITEQDGFKASGLIKPLLPSSTSTSLAPEW